MPTVAELLRQGREAQNLSVHQLADLTKMRTDHIRALEEGNYGVFSAPVYIRGFVRTCASILKLNLPTVIAALDEELSQTKKFREHPPLTAKSGGIVDWFTLQLSKVNWKVALPAIGVILVLFAIIWIVAMVRAQSSRDPLRNLGPGMYQPAKSQGGEVLPLPPPPKK